MPLATARNALLRKPDVCDWVKMADKYMAVYVSDKRRFVLPEEHKELDPIVKHYASRQKDFARFLLELRDAFPRGTAQYAELNKFYRTVLARAIQQERRVRSDRALELAEETYGPAPSFSERLQWVARREAEWASERLDYLAERRRKTTGNKLSRDETNQLLEEFWAMVDHRIEEEGVPAWDE